MNKLAPAVHAQTGGGDSGDMLYDELWSEPRNLVGSPRNRAMDGSRIGAVLPEGSNFEFSVPVVGLPGRGLPSGVSLSYNSRIWSRRSNKVTFNAVNSWPYLGFTLSFGRLVTYGSDPNTKFVFIDGDGTRHFLGTGPSYLENTLQSNDGSHITYVGSAWGGAIHYNNGVTMYLNLANNRVLVAQIRDANGNYMSISYQNQTTPSCNNGAGFQWKQAISSITDTLGRVITFNYDNCNNLISITGPGLGGTSTTFAQFDYNVVWGSVYQLQRIDRRERAGKLTSGRVEARLLSRYADRLQIHLLGVRDDLQRIDAQADEHRSERQHHRRNRKGLCEF